jgi:hypothetical protein
MVLVRVARVRMGIEILPVYDACDERRGIAPKVVEQIGRSVGHHLVEKLLIFQLLIRDVVDGLVDVQASVVDFANLSFFSVAAEYSEYFYLLLSKVFRRSGGVSLHNSECGNSSHHHSHPLITTQQRLPSI